MRTPDHTTTGRCAGLFAFALLATAALSACDGGDDAGAAARGEGGHAADTASGQTMDPAAGAGPTGLTTLDPWVRVSIRPEGSDAPGAAPVNSAAYLVLRNAGTADDAIVGVETEVADTAELHSASMEDDVMRMRAVDSVPLTAGGDAVLEPGGYHVMLIGLNRDLAEGDGVPLLLRLRSGDSVRVMAPVLRSPPQQ